MVATSGTEQDGYTPESLKDVADAPVFWLRPMTGRTLPRYRHALRSAGLKFHGPAEVRAETLKALENLWSADGFSEHSGRLDAFWRASDAYEKAVRDWRQAGGTGEEPDLFKLIAREEVEAIQSLQERLSDAWPALAAMAADNSLFMEESPRVALTMVLAGWSGIDLPFAMEDGRVPMLTIDRLEKKLTDVERQAVERNIDIGAPGLAFMQLTSRALTELNLGGVEEKN